jgi:tetraacyldisaccharide 4'-kinase
LLYCLIVLFKKRSRNTYTPPLPVISIGNLTVGGSGKTPVTIELARRYPKSAVVLRGYGRRSKGLKVVKSWEALLENVQSAGDEAMVYADALPGSLVIVAENRIEGIEKAKALGAKVVFLDDGHSKYAIQKLDILIKPDPEPATRFCLPSGAYREPYAGYARADFVLDERHDIIRSTRLIHPREKMVLITAIAKPGRLERFLPEVVGKVYFEDHHFFTREELESAINSYDADAILCTAKDAVKIREFGLPLSVMALDVTLAPALLERVDAYIAAHGI